MDDTAKYLIHATMAADGVVERSDVVGAVFGQTEGLLGDELDLRGLQESSKVGRIDVDVESENGQSFGEVTVASSLDKVETAILGASLETIDRIGPCRASVEVRSIEDVRAAKRREVVERAKELLAEGFEETSLASTDVLEEVRDAARVEGIDEYEGLPAGPRVGDSDAVIVVEGRADVLTLLEGGIKNAVAVEGTNVPETVADLTRDRTVTAFLDGDRGGELILRELTQVGEIDYVAFAPPGKSVEDLNRGAVFEALRGKIPYETLADEPNLRRAAADRTRERTDATGSSADAETGAPEGTDGTGDPEDTDDAEDPEDTDGAEDPEGTDSAENPGTGEAGAGAFNSTDRHDHGDTDRSSEESSGIDAVDDGDEADDVAEGEADVEIGGTGAETEDTDTESEEVGAESEEVGAESDDAVVQDDESRSLEEHVKEVIDAGSGLARLLADDLGVQREVEATAAFDAIAEASDPPHTVIVDGRIDQRLLDIGAQRGVGELLGRETGEYVKRPIGVRVRTVGDLQVDVDAIAE
ncbi:DNA primase DnaG [Halorubrum vacuolatum]|uniref:DNA primase DnaG n=1 Tax=Halorubrum vacuolatum TaxID=63740 RepID=A0A238V9H1_HALVU|nr:DNA primase DnaG [Halorubrum vacuolatum]SNR31082.1 Toprim domain-containing protein [Halorubrum vacuolatum]